MNGSPTRRGGKNKELPAKHAKHTKKETASLVTPLPFFASFRVFRGQQKIDLPPNTPINANEKGIPPAQTLSPFFAFFSVSRGQ